MAGLILKFTTQTPPLTLLVVVKLTKPDKVKFVGSKNLAAGTEPDLTFPATGAILRGDAVIARYFARLAPQLNLLAADTPFSASELDEILEFSFHKLAPAKDPAPLLQVVNTHLTLKTFLVGHALSLADVAVWAAIRSNSAARAQVANSAHLSRWYAHLESLPEFKEVIVAHLLEVTAAAPKQTSGKYEDLPGAVMGKVVTRFPPEPSGFLHIGHAKALLLNEHYARHYGGKLVIRFDDTNPVKEKEEYEEQILADLGRLGIKGDVLSHTSDFFPRILEVAETLLKDGHAYIDESTSAEINKQRELFQPSPARDNTVEKNFELWEQMKLGSEKGKKCVMRAKIDFASKNGALRDPNLYRVVDMPHARTGKTYKVYPTYDMAAPLVDSWEGVTHALRSNEYHDRNALYDWMLTACKLQHRPIIMDFSRLNFSWTLMSKRKLQWFVDNDFVAAWNDPSFPTIQGLLRRGLTVSALRQFVKSQGASKSTVLIDTDKLWALNKQEIDPVVPRYIAIPTDSKVPVKLTNGPAGVEGKTQPLHKKNESLGTKVVLYAPTILIEAADAKLLKKDEEVTLMYWGNAFIRDISTNAAGEVTGVVAELHLAGNFKDTEKKLTWLAQTEELIPLTLLDFAPLITKPSLGESDKFEDFVAPQIRFETAALGDPNLKALKKGDKLQLERRGYFIVDEPHVEGSKQLVLIEIPDGKKKDVSVLSAKKTQSKAAKK